MEIVSIPIDKLKPAEYNPRQMTEKQAEDLRESIKRFGIVDPIIVNSYKGRKNRIIGGHQRYYLALEMGYDELPVVYVSLDEEKERELNLRLNRNLGEWDWDILANFDIGELAEVGFAPYELNKGFGLGLEGDDILKEWQGMPEFSNPPKAARSIQMHFETEEAVEKFSELIEQDITEKTKYLWFPYKERARESRRWKSES